MAVGLKSQSMVNRIFFGDMAWLLCVEGCVGGEGTGGESETWVLCCKLTDLFDCGIIS